MAEHVEWATATDVTVNTILGVDGQGVILYSGAALALAITGTRDQLDALIDRIYDAYPQPVGNVVEQPVPETSA